MSSFHVNNKKKGLRKILAAIRSDMTHPDDIVDEDGASASLAAHSYLLATAIAKIEKIGAKKRRAQPLDNNQKEKKKQKEKNTRKKNESK